MGVSVFTEVVRPRKLAAVRRRVAIGGVAAAWRPALDQVWEFLRAHPELHTGGHNVFLYHHPANRHEPMAVDFGVEVTRHFEAAGDVRPTETPDGEVAAALHVGPYDVLEDTHDTIHAWAEARQRRFAGQSWEIYGD